MEQSKSFSRDRGPSPLKFSASCLQFGGVAPPFPTPPHPARHEAILTRKSALKYFLTATDALSCIASQAMNRQGGALEPSRILEIVKDNKFPLAIVKGQLKCLGRGHVFSGIHIAR